MPTRIVAISDTHNAHNKLAIPECDILIHAGDESYRGQATEIMAFAEWISQQPAKHIVWTPGNHSLAFEANWPHSLTWVKHINPNIHILIQNSVELEGIKIWGSPITPYFHNWAYNIHRGPEIKQYWDQIPDNTDIVVTHGPPHGILDLTNRNIAAGCVDLRNAIARVKPKLHVFGHIHESYGIEHHAGTTFVNAAIMNDTYFPENPPTEIIYENLP